MNIIEGLQAASAKRQQIQEEAAAAVKAIAAPGFELFMREHPNIEAIRWTQHTPYFNDGEECVFSVGELYYKLVGADGEDEDDFEYLSSYSKPEGFDQQQWFKDLEQLASAISGSDEEMLAAFGDHVRVTVTKEGVDVEEYEHD